MGFHFTKMIASLTVHKHASSVKPLLLIFGLNLRKRNPIQKVLAHIYIICSILPVFSSSSFKVLGVTFRSLMHLELVLTEGERCRPIFIILQVDQFSKHRLLKMLYFLQLMFFGTFVKHRIAGLHVLIVGFSFFVLLVCMTVSGSVQYLFFITMALKYISKLGIAISSALFLLLRIVLVSGVICDSTWILA